MQTYYAEIEDDKESAWTGTNYGLSKECENAYTRVLAKKLAARPAGQKIYVNCICPGYTTSDMASEFMQSRFGDEPLPEGYVWRGPDEAARDAVWQTLLPGRDMPSGIFSAEKAERAF